MGDNLTSSSQEPQGKRANKLSAFVLLPQNTIIYSLFPKMGEVRIEMNIPMEEEGEVLHRRRRPDFPSPYSSPWKRTHPSFMGCSTPNGPSSISTPGRPAVVGE